MESNYWTDDSIFEAYSDQLGNYFAAIRTISNCGRQLAESCNNEITHSQALCWVVTGEIPEVLFRPKNKHKTEDKVDSIISQCLSLVEREDVKRCVKKTIHEYCKSYNLSYHYEKLICEEDRSRVRILCNIIIDKLKTS